MQGCQNPKNVTRLGGYNIGPKIKQTISIVVSGTTMKLLEENNHTISSGPPCLIQKRNNILITSSSGEHQIEIRCVSPGRALAFYSVSNLGISILIVLYSYNKGWTKKNKIKNQSLDPVPAYLIQCSSSSSSSSFLVPVIHPVLQNQSTPSSALVPVYLVQCF